MQRLLRGRLMRALQAARPTQPSPPTLFAAEVRLLHSLTEQFTKLNSEQLRAGAALFCIINSGWYFIFAHSPDTTGNAQVRFCINCRAVEIFMRDICKKIRQEFCDNSHFLPFYFPALAPVEGRKTVDIQKNNYCRYHIREKRSHPVLDFEPLALVSLCLESVPAPAIALIATE